MSLVSFIKIQEKNSLKKDILHSLDLIQYPFPTKIKDVVIKPNMCYYWDYTTGQTTDPRFIGALIDLLREQISSNVNISIVESDASAMKCKYAFKFLGYERLAHKQQVELINLSKDKTVKESTTVNKEKFTFRVPQTIKEADLLINVPKIKYLLPMVKITCALKNIYGCNPYPNKYRYHKTLDEVIVALNKLMKFDLCILDGNIVSGVKPKKLGLIMASQDPVAFDTAAAEIASVNPKSVKYLTLAHKEGLGEFSFIPKGMDLNYFKKKYPRRTSKDKILAMGYRMIYKVGLQKRLGLE